MCHTFFTDLLIRMTFIHTLCNIVYATEVLTREVSMHDTKTHSAQIVRTKRRRIGKREEERRKENIANRYIGGRSV